MEGYGRSNPDEAGLVSAQLGNGARKFTSGHLLRHSLKRTEDSREEPPCMRVWVEPPEVTWKLTGGTLLQC